MKTDLEPWKSNLEPWKTIKTNLNHWKPIKTEMEPWKTNLEPSKLTWSCRGWLWGVQVVTGDSQEEVIIFRDKQTHMHHNIYIVIIIIISVRRVGRKWNWDLQSKTDARRGSNQRQTNAPLSKWPAVNHSTSLWNLKMKNNKSNFQDTPLFT